MMENISYFHVAVEFLRAWVKGIKVVHSDETIIWTNLNNGQKWRFNKQKIKDDINCIREEAAIYKSFFSQKGIEYVGVGSDW